MQERIVEIILLIVSELRSDKNLHEVDLNKLVKNGYTDSEISTAFSWIYERLSTGNVFYNVDSMSKTSFRVLNEQEKNIITKEAYGYLIQCCELGLLQNLDIEVIIDQIMNLEHNITIGYKEIKAFVATYIFEVKSKNIQYLLNINDTVH